MTDTFGRNIAISFGLHIAVVLVIFFQAVLIPREPLELRNAIRVDVVGLPEKIEKPAELKPKPETPQAEPPPPPKPKLPPKEATPEPTMKAPVMPKPSPTAKKVDLEKAQTESLKKLKAMSALDKIKEQLAEEKSKEKDKNAKPTQVVKGNAVNEGNSLTGLEKLDFERYFDDLKTKVRGRWNIPEWMADAKLKAAVLVMIDERGYVVKKVFRRSSGNVVFDNSVIAAIESSSPLPPPPKRLQGLLETNGIVLNFPE